MDRDDAARVLGARIMAWHLSHRDCGGTQAWHSGAVSDPLGRAGGILKCYGCGLAIEVERAPFVDPLAPLARERNDLHDALGRIADWTMRHGAALCPTEGSADTFGDGMRAAKRQVLALIRGAQ